MKIFVSILSVALLLSVSADAVSIPFNFEENEFGGGDIFIPCAYNSFSTNCFFDSGADNFVANNSVTENLTPIRQVTFTGGSGVEKICDVVNIDNWITGEFSVSNLEAIRCADSQPSDTLGLSYFSNVDFSLDFSNQKIETYPSLPSGVVIRPLSVYSTGHVAVEVQVGNTQTFAMFDTGASISAVDDAVVVENPQAFVFARKLSGHDSTGAPMVVNLFKLTGFSVGDIPIGEAYIVSKNLDFVHKFGNGRSSGIIA